MTRSAVITGTGMAVPPKVVTNDDLAKMMDTSDEWIRQRTGIEERRWIEEGTGPADLAYAAAKKALEAAACEPNELDYILVATLSPETYFPGTVSYLQAKLGLTKTPGLDLRAQCSGFIYALEVAQAMIVSGLHRKILVIGVEVQSVALDKSNRGRDMAVLFGDGAGAAILEASDRPHAGILKVVTRLEGVNAEKLMCEAPAARKISWVDAGDIEEGRIHPKMDGKYVFKNAVTRMPEVIGEVLGSAKLRVADINFWLFHQANLRINEHIAQSMGIPQEKTYNNIQKYGNMSAASIAVALDECVRAGRIKDQDLVMMTAFGAGFTWGAALLRWQTRPNHARV